MQDCMHGAVLKHAQGSSMVMHLVGFLQLFQSLSELQYEAFGCFVRQREIGHCKQSVMSRAGIEAIGRALLNPAPR